MSTKIKQFEYSIKGFTFYGLAEIELLKGVPIASVTDLYIEDWADGSCPRDVNPRDVQTIIDYAIIIEIEQRLEHDV